MPTSRAREIAITETELAQRAQRLGVDVQQGEQPEQPEQVEVRHVLRFIKDSENQDELKQIAIQARERLREMGVLPAKRKTGAVDRFISRLAVESIPIALTILVIAPLVTWVSLNGVRLLRYTDFFQHSCPPNCDSISLITLAAISSLAALFVLFVYATMRRFFLKSRK